MTCYQEHPSLSITHAQSAATSLVQDCPTYGHMSSWRSSALVREVSWMLILIFL